MCGLSYKCTHSVYFMEKLERWLKFELVLRQLENDSSRFVYESTNLFVLVNDWRRGTVLSSTASSRTWII